jgi:FkbM family methyltransferase
MQTKDVEGWTVPIYEIPLAGSCRSGMKSKYRDWDRLKAIIFQIQERKVLIDVGANFGLVTVPGMKYFKKVIAIEPHPVTAYCLRENTSKTRGKAEVIEAVASTQKGTTLLYDPPNQYTSGYSSIIPKEDWTSQTVKTMSIDGLGLPTCEFIKIDVQGAELDVIKGAEHTIKLYKPWIYVETKESRNSVNLLRKWGYASIESYGVGHTICTHRKRLR